MSTTANRKGLESTDAVRILYNDYGRGKMVQAEELLVLDGACGAELPPCYASHIDVLQSVFAPA